MRSRTRRLKSALRVIVVLRAVAAWLPACRRDPADARSCPVEKARSPLPRSKAARLGPAARWGLAFTAAVGGSLRDRDVVLGGPGAHVAALERGGEHVRELVRRAGEDRRAERGQRRRVLVVVGGRAVVGECEEDDQAHAGPE